MPVLEADSRQLLYYGSGVCFVKKVIALTATAGPDQ